MNLVSGLEESPGWFYYVAASSIAWGAAVYSSLVWQWRRPMYNTRRRLADMTALQDLLVYNVDIIGEVLLGPIRKVV